MNNSQPRISSIVADRCAIHSVVQGTPQIRTTTSEHQAPIVTQIVAPFSNVTSVNGMTGDVTLEDLGFVTSVAGKTGAVVLDKADVGLDKVDNTSDLEKPVSNLVKTEIDKKQDKLPEGSNNQFLSHNGTDVIWSSEHNQEVWKLGTDTKPTTISPLSLKETINALKTESSDLNYVHNQSQALYTWSVTHNLNKYPSVTVIDSAGSTVEGTITYISNEEIKIQFSSPFSGKAILN